MLKQGHYPPGSSSVPLDMKRLSATLDTPFHIQVDESVVVFIFNMYIDNNYVI